PAPFPSESMFQNGGNLSRVRKPRNNRAPLTDFLRSADSPEIRERGPQPSAPHVPASRWSACSTESGPTHSALRAHEALPQTLPGGKPPETPAVALDTGRPSHGSRDHREGFLERYQEGARMEVRPEDALAYHSSPPAGKVGTIATKPCRTQHDLSLAYSPGVAVPCLEIARAPSLVYKYTAKGNLVAVVTNGTAVLGLGNIGPAAGKPVMEGKAVLFKRFADIDVFDIELATSNADEIIRTCQLLEPTFGGINLEDIKAPECFYIEEELKKTMKIPVFHDDQHGT